MITKGLTTEERDMLHKTVKNKLTDEIDKLAGPLLIEEKTQGGKTR